MSLDRRTIAAAALDLLDEVGLEGVTTRRLAERLGVRGPSLYWHFKTKDLLFDHMADAMFADAIAVDDAVLKTRAWDEWLAAGARVIRRAALSRRDGARLLAVYGIQQSGDGLRVRHFIQRAYNAVRNAPVPSVAAIRGACYGCGLEFTLHCHYRLAAETCDTNFYMTEVQDSLVLPAFGSMRDLPRLLGLRRAVDFLLWGERWTAREASKRGLVDASFADESFEANVNAFVARLARGDRPDRSAPTSAPRRARAWGWRSGRSASAPARTAPPTTCAAPRHGCAAAARGRGWSCW